MPKQKKTWIIQDWAGNEIRIKNKPVLYASFEDAEEVLSEFLGDDYEDERGEYYIIDLSEEN